MKSHERVAKAGRLASVAHILSSARITAHVVNKALSAAMTHGHALVVARLLADARSDPLCTAVASAAFDATFDHADVIRALLADGRFDPSAGDSRLLWAASAHYGNEEATAAFLEDARIDPSARSNELLKRSAA